jgi:hypothetical protein
MSPHLGTLVFCDHLEPVDAVVSREKIRKVFRYVFIGLPLAGVIVADFLPLTIRSQQFLIMIVLIWMQVFFVFEVFFPGK